MTPTREVFVVVHRGQEALVLLRAPEDSYWHIVAGGVEDGETYRAAAARELQEEVALDAGGKLHSLRHPLTIGEVAIECFAVEAAPAWEPTLNEEHTEYRWCGFGEAIELVRWPEAKEVLELLGERVGRRPGRLRFRVKRPREPAVFFLRFPAEAGAEEAGSVLEEDGFAVTVEVEPSHWLVCARGEIRKDSFDVAERALAELAAAKGGRYAGYRRG